MSLMLDLVKNQNVKEFDAGATVIEQGQRCGVMLILIKGEVEILRDEIQVAKSSQPGVIFGEMSVLLHSTHTATVRTTAPSRFAVIENPREFMERSAGAGIRIAELLASRLDAVNKYLVDLKRQSAGKPIDMSDGVLESIMYRQEAAQVK